MELCKNYEQGSQSTLTFLHFEINQWFFSNQSSLLDTSVFHHLSSHLPSMDFFCDGHPDNLLKFNLYLYLLPYITKKQHHPDNNYINMLKDLLFYVIIYVYSYI